MAASGDGPETEGRGVCGGRRTWGLIRRTLPLGRSIGSLSYLISVGLLASWIIAVFFGVSLFFLMPRSAKLASGLSPGDTRFDDSSAKAPWLMQSTSRLDRLSSPSTPEPAQPTSNAAADKGRPVVVPSSPTTASIDPSPVPAQPTIAHAADRPPAPPLRLQVGPISSATPE